MTPGSPYAELRWLVECDTGIGPVRWRPVAAFSVEVAAAEYAVRCERHGSMPYRTRHYVEDTIPTPTTRTQ